MRVVASAPGKLVLLGEYAVLEGAPALVLAANRRAEVSIQPAEPGQPYSVTACDGEERRARFELGSDGTPRWRETGAGRRLSLVERILGSLLRSGTLDGSALHPFEARLVTAAFFQHTAHGRAEKLGLGSSAALTVAFASGLAEYTGRTLAGDERQIWLARLLELHRDFQRGHGSGLDVAASLYGGVIDYRLGGSDGRPCIRRINLPRGLELLAVWSGRPASTRGSLERLAAWRAEHPRVYARVMAELAEVALAGARAAGAGDAPALLETVDAYGAGLRRLGDASDIDIFCAEHERIASLARSAAAVYKPCGAGGGDIGLAFTTDGQAIAELRKNVQAAGFQTLGLSIDPVGLQTTTEPGASRANLSHT